ncbi:S41 family peptidase [Chitinimonas sp. BJYL2]|uniref:S41 family peptidase n=1 Tax=Chitinimonas sp. BJYL2 TaxID=2976696 RepID=UPI0022B51307|nr:S41 family peptidase [Chitinimonas sp. BJYL2]
MTTPPTSTVKAQACSPNNPYRGDAEGTTTIGTLSDEKRWVRDYIDRNYLWYRDVPVVDANDLAYSNESKYYESLDNYFNALKSPLFTASGKRKDEFSFTYPTKAWDDMANSGTSLGYGIEWHLDSARAPRGIKVAYVEPGSAAAQAGVRRGDLLVTVDGVSADGTTSLEVDTLNAALYPAAQGSHNFVFNRTGATQFTVTLQAATVAKQPVLVAKTLDAGGAKVGYMVFNDHIATAEQPLIDAVNQFKTAGVTDLVLDLRYNGGGYLYLANQLAYMIAGPARAQGKVFTQLQYNDKRAADTAASRDLFRTTACKLNSQFYCTSGDALPTLGLARVYIIASNATCSASESIINGLRGVDVDVQLIGGTTCGKPYGFTAKDNCGISYFPIEFSGTNAKGFGDYADGFAATCRASDDFSSQLGDSNEGMLSAALYKRANGSCKPAAAARMVGGEPIDGLMLRGPLRENAFTLPKRQ